MLFIGIFESCTQSSQNETISDSMLCQKVIQKTNLNKHEFWRFAAQRGNYDIKDLLDANDFTYQSYTFCSHEEAVEIAVNIKLNQTYLVSNSTQKEPKWNKKSVKDWSRSSRIVLVMIHVARIETSDTYRDLFLGENFVVFFLDNGYSLSSSYQMTNLHAATDFLKVNSERLLFHIDSAVWDHKGNYEARNPVPYFGLIYIESDSLLYKLEFQYLYEKYLTKFYKELGKCFFIYKLNMTSVESLENLTNKLSTDHYMTFIIAIGDPFDQVKLLLHLESKKLLNRKQWILYDVYYEYFSSVFKSMTASLRWFVFSFDYHTLRYYIDSKHNDLVASLGIDLGMNNEFTADKFLVAENCKHTFEDQLIRMMVLVNSFKRLDLFKYVSFGEFKVRNVRRSNLRGSRTRSFVHFFGNRLFRSIVSPMCMTPKLL